MADLTLTAVVVSHANERGLRAILGNLRYQTRKPDETLAFVSGVSRGVFCRLAEEFADVAFFLEDDFDDWGHAKRAAGVERSSSALLGFFNDDDSYASDYVEKMMRAAEESKPDVVFCEWNENPGCDFRIYQSTAGNFIVSTLLARHVGYTGSEYEADGHFIEALKAAGAAVVKVDERLYFHNVPAHEPTWG